MAAVKDEIDQVSDGHLLRQYAADGSQEAFARVARRHVDKVYSAALRQVRSPHQADDVTQAVFIALARKAATLSGYASIGGWLLKATHLAVKNLRRIESRRRRHELHAAQQRTLDMLRMEKDTNPDADVWSGIAPLLDGALSVLPDAVRDALTLRYLEGLDFTSVACTLGISQEAARKRVERGVEKLRGIFASRGINVPADLLGQLLLIHAVGPAPQGVAQAAAGAAAAINHLTVAKGVVTVMAWSKAKILATCAAGALLVGGGGAVVHHVLAAQRQTTVVALTTPPVITSVAPAGGLELHGQVVLPDGQPVTGARVIASIGPRYVEIFCDPRLSPPEAQVTTVTDATGAFCFNASALPNGVVVTCPQGIGRATAAQLAHHARIELMPWARIEGDIALDGIPGANAQILLSDYRDEPHVQLNAMADAKGHYAITEVPPGNLYMSCSPPGQRCLNGGITALPGSTCTANFITRSGHTIVAHLGPVPVSGEAVVALLNLDPQPAGRGEVHFVPSAYQQDSMAQAGTELRFEHIPPGEYRLHFSLMDSKHAFKLYIAETHVSVPGSPSSAALDLGTVTLRPMDMMHQGTPPKSTTTKPTSRPQ